MDKLTILALRLLVCLARTSQLSLALIKSRIPPHDAGHSK
jgi:hypothetical protein